MEAPSPKPLHVVFSDKHLSAGSRLPDGKPNPIEDFKGDAQWDRVTDVILAELGGRPGVLYDNGDLVDFQATPLLRRSFARPWRKIWKWKEVPTVEAALEKLDLVLRAHPGHFEAVRRFLRAHPGNRYRVTVGNHDQAFAWPEVQARILREFGDLAGRVEFGRIWIVGDALVGHGAEVDPVNRLPDDERMFVAGKVGNGMALAAVAVALATFLLGIRPIKSLLAGEADWTFGNAALAVFAFIPYVLLFSWGWGRIAFIRRGGRKILNVAYASYMNAGLAMELKRRFFPWIGRMQDHGPIWVVALARDWHYAVAILPMLLFHVVVYMALGKTTPAGAWRVLASTTHEDQIDEHLPAFVRQHAGIRHFVFGHTHVAGFWTKDVGGRTVVVTNTGTGGEQIRMRTPEVRIATRFRRIEGFLRRVAFHWRQARRAAMFFTAVHLGLIGVLQAADAFLEGPLGWINPIGTAALVYLLLARQSYALYRGEAFTEWTPAFIEIGGDGTVAVRLKRIDPERGKVTSYSEGPSR